MTEEKKKSGCLRFILIGLVLVLAPPILWLTFNNGPLASAGNPLVEISPETTRITEPLDQNGDVDYLEALNLRLSKGITPDNNAGVLYVRAFGRSTLDEKFFSRYLTRLGIDGSQVHENPLIDFDEWFAIRQREQPIEFQSNSDALDDPQEQYRYLMDNAAPWPEEQFPFIDEWFDEYSEVAKTIRDATKREQCYFPLIARSKPQVMSSLLTHPQKMRHAARYFSMSALRHLHNKEFEKFIGDLQCMEQIAQHAAQGPTLVEELISIAIKRMTLARIIAACDLEIGADDLKNLLAFVETFEPSNDMVSRIDNCDRYMAIDAAIASGRGEAEVGFTYPQAFVDWNETLRVLNEEFDFLVKKLSEKDPASRKAGALEVWNRLEEMQKNTSVEFMTSAMLGRKSKGRWMGKVLASMLMPAFDQMLETEVKLKSEIEMAQIAVAISIYREEKGQLPESVQQLVPTYLKSIPIEEATKKPYIMSKTDTGAGFRVQSTAWVEGAEEEGVEIMIAPATISFEEFLNK